MTDNKLLNYGIGYLKNTASYYLYDAFGVNISKPAQISALITYRCNSRCQMCSYWKQEEGPEMSIEEWKAFLTQMKKWHRTAHVQFSGGEPFVKKHSIEIFEHCAKIGLSFGVTTNLTMLPIGGVERFIETEPFNINVSLDGINPETHDYCRGVKGSHARAVKNLDEFVKAGYRQNKKIRIIIKTIIMNRNLDELEDLVRFVEEKGLTGINFQPIFKWSNTSSGDLWVTDINKIDKVAQKLIEMKNNGYPILTPERDLKALKGYFNEEISVNQYSRKCAVGIKNFDILPNGDVFLCRTINSKVGNVVTNSPVEIWRSHIANRERVRISNCKKSCLLTCQTRRTIKELYKAFRRLSRSTKKK